MVLNPGTVVGGYRIERILGAGGMGTVYLGKHPSLPRMDALKVLSAELSRDPEFRARFQREANLAAGLDHNNVVSVYNRGEEHGQLWIAMQYVDGTDAAAELARDPHAMTPLRALRITTEVGKGLDHAHRRGLLHRDVKPANFLLSSTDGDEERVLLTDFGVAKSTDDATELTQTGSFLATIAYAPPEQLSGANLDHRADIYSLACAFYKLLTGQNPYPAVQPAMVMMGHLHEPPPQATRVRPGLPYAIDHVFARAMAKNPAERFATCREFTDAASNALTPGFNPTGHNTSPTYPIQVMPPREHTDPRLAASLHGLTASTSIAARKPKRAVLIGGGAVVAIALIAGVGVFALSRNDASTNPPGSETSSVAGTGALTPLEQTRKDNPAFQGKTITLLDVTQQPNKYGVYLTGSPQTRFMEKLGFVYNFEYANTEGVPSPKAITDSAGSLEAPDDSYVIVLRSDEKAGGGGLLGLPYGITSSRAIVIPIDDPSTVSAMRNWTAESEGLMISKLIPVLKTKIR
ncbi:serine/threonine-protein kinase [Nocardia salmonicida]|uniref:serine/threonine-protein kinase n=1 Tax=Nocardia salmonicida TaxID=53431 RepID=UPI0007A3F392|nr:serine/threonine-protein kinase [Nocardia salmonicida]